MENKIEEINKLININQSYGNGFSLKTILVDAIFICIIGLPFKYLIGLTFFESFIMAMLIWVYLGMYAERTMLRKNVKILANELHTVICKLHTDRKVYVVESDIKEIQKRNSTIEQRAAL